MLVMVMGCGKKDDKALEEDSVTEEVQDSTDTKETAADDIVEEESDDIAVTKENVRNINAHIRSVNKVAEDELKRSVVGYMRRDYIEIDDEARDLCPGALMSSITLVRKHLMSHLLNL